MTYVANNCNLNNKYSQIKNNNLNNMYRTIYLLPKASYPSFVSNVKSDFIIQPMKKEKGKRKNENDRQLFL